MIIVCPSCATKYDVAVTKPRKARCQCGTVFEVAPATEPDLTMEDRKVVDNDESLPAVTQLDSGEDDDEYDDEDISLLYDEGVSASFAPVARTQAVAKDEDGFLAHERERKRIRNQEALDELSRSLDYAEEQQRQNRAYAEARQRRQRMQDYFYPEPQPTPHSPWTTAAVLAGAVYLWTHRHDR